MIEFNIYEKRIVIAILIAIMEADGIIDPYETNYLDNIISSFEMSESDLDSLDELDFNLIISDFKKFDVAKKKAAVKFFLDMANCDGYADSRELEIINSLDG